MENIRRIDGARISIHNNVAYFGGHVSSIPHSTLREQTKAVLARYDELFEQYSMKKENIIYRTTFVRDISNVKEFKEEYERWIGDITPAGVTVEAACITPTKLIEIAFIVALD